MDFSMLLKRKDFIMNYKLIAIDLDGTLYNDNIMITPKTIDALMKAQDMEFVLLSHPAVLFLACFMPEIL